MKKKLTNYKSTKSLFVQLEKLYYNSSQKILINKVHRVYKKYGSGWNNILKNILILKWKLSSWKKITTITQAVNQN